MNRVNLFFSLGLLLVLTGCSYGPGDVSLASHMSRHETRTYLHYQPAVASSDTWFLMYPGGLVAPSVYGEWASELASSGIHVVVAKMPYNLAVTAVNRGLKIMEEFPEAQQWVIGGHSLGGAMACSFVNNHPETVEGLILMAAYPGGSADLSEWNGSVLSLSGEFDGLTTREAIQEREHLLPEPFVTTSIFSWPTSLTGATVYHEIPGGNHAQFGTYGAQEGDGEAKISTADQHQTLVTWIELFFKLNGWT